METTPALICRLFLLVLMELRNHLERCVQNLLDVLPVEPFDATASHVYGKLCFRLQQAEIIVAAMDLLIASHALALERTLISDDQVFAQVPGLHLVQAS